jgi:hypothetical protein
MKPRSKQVVPRTRDARPPDQRARRQGAPGFALVTTLILMLLITVIAVGMLSLASVSLRATGASSHQATARTNARLALMLAIGELQKEIGPDQRVTAHARILDPQPTTPGAENMAQPMWLGTWNSWTDWLNSPKQKQTYQKGRSSRFRSWLVSGGDAAMLENPDLAKTGVAGDQSIELVGTGTLGTQAADDQKVIAPKVPMPGGAYGWWVGGENQKARFTESKAPEGRMELVNTRSSWPKSDLRKIDGLSALDFPVGMAAKTASLASLEFLADETATRERIKQHFHDLTTDSSGVLANVRHGGLKKDLNLLLERQELPAEFGTFSASNPRGSIVPLRDENEEIPAAHYGDKNPNFSSWYKLHQYYSLYKGTGDERASDSIPLPFRKGLWGNGAPQVNFNWDSGNYDQIGLARTPILSRVMMVFSSRRVPSRVRGRFDYKLGVNPVVVIWNPYNVTLHAGRMFIELGPGALEYKAYIDDSQAFDWKQVKLSQKADGEGAFRVRVYPMEGPGPANYEKPIILKPGETRIYSARSGFVHADNQYHVELYPGYQPPEANGGFDVPLDGCTNLGEDARVELAMRVSDARTENGNVHQLYYVARNQQTGDQQRYSEIACNPIKDGETMTIVEDSPGMRVICPKSEQRVTFASFQIALKSGEDLRSPGGHGQQDYRNKNFIHANPVNQRASYGEATDRMRGMSQYQVHVQQGTGNALNPDFDPKTNRAYIGSAISLGNSTWPGQPSVITNELSVVPVTSLASLAHFKLNPGRTSHASEQHLWDIAANQALGIGNSFAHPLIPAGSIYQDVPDLAARGGNEWLEFKLQRDTYDRAYLANDALWDDWFFSTITPQDKGIYHESRPLADVARDFVERKNPLPNPHLEPWSGPLDDDDLTEVFVDGGAPAEDAWKKASSHLMLDGAFNINSTSVDAWKTFFWGLRGGTMLYLDPDSGNVSQKRVPENRVAFSRFSLPGSADEGSNAGDPASWLGIRLLDEKQIDRLAAECVRQVKLRGPFLNMADFVNRRLDDGETGVRGALQAAIDWDETDGNSPVPSSINGRFKTGDDMITTGTVGRWGLEFPEAAAGSRFTGIPGYLTQADVLKRIGNMLTPRDDTFRIRAYGESKSPDGKTMALAWCEAVVRRVPEYLDPRDEAHVATSDLSSGINRNFGRKLELISFRWLSHNEI